VIDLKKNISKIKLIIIIIISLFITGCFESSEHNNENTGGYTAFENIDEVFDLADNDTNNLYFRSIQCFQHTSNGYFNSISYWFYDIRYNNETDNYYYFAGFNVLYKYNENPKINFNPIIPQQSFPDPNDSHPFARINYTSDLLDSDEAYSIAVKNDVIKSFLKKASKYSYSLSDSGLRADYNWYFNWIYDDDPRDEGWFEGYIEIDARNGEVVRVMVPGND